MMCALCVACCFLRVCSCCVLCSFVVSLLLIVDWVLMFVRCLWFVVFGSSLLVIVCVCCCCALGVGCSRLLLGDV